jgi:hypothetical protein
MRQRTFLQLVALTFLSGAVFFGCSSAQKSDDDKGHVWVDQIALVSLHYRRPQVAGADPDAGPGGVDYYSHPLPNSRLDCEPAENLFKDLKLDAIRDCMNSTKLSNQDFILTFSVQKSIRPLLLLHKEENQDGNNKNQPRRPNCVDELLSEIPVPREIYYQGQQEGQKGKLECYVSGLKPETPPLLGVRLKHEKTELAVNLPPVRPLKTKQDVQLLLLSWALRPFWDSQRDQLRARAIPDSLCRLCIGEKNLVEMGIPPVPLWPTEEESDAVPAGQPLHDAKP